MGVRRPKDRSGWGDKAFRAMHDADPKTLKELLETSAAKSMGWPTSELVRRLRLLDERHREDDPEVGGGCICGWSWPCPDRRILDGGE